MNIKYLMKPWEKAPMERFARHYIDDQVSEEL